MVACLFLSPTPRGDLKIPCPGHSIHGKAWGCPLPRMREVGQTHQADVSQHLCDGCKFVFQLYSWRSSSAWYIPEGSARTDTSVYALWDSNARQQVPPHCQPSKEIKSICIISSPNQLIPLIAKTLEYLARRLTLCRTHSAFLSCCHGFSFPTKVHYHEDLPYFYFTFTDHKSLRVLDGARLFSYLQTPLLSSQGGHLLYGCMQPNSELNMVWCPSLSQIQCRRQVILLSAV